MIKSKFCSQFGNHKISNTIRSVLRKNFNLMKDVGNVTRVMPDKRVESLMKFRRRLADNPDVNTKFAQVLCKIIDRKK